MRKIVIDTNSLVDFIKFYSKMIGFNKVFELIKNKIQEDNLILIDKVKNEIKFHEKEGRVLSELPLDKAIDTKFLLTDFDRVNNWYLEKNELGKSPAKIERLKQIFREKNADAYLVLYCLYLKNHGNDVKLISDESFREDNKLYMKLPKICERENISYGHLTDYLFGELKDEIKIGVIE